MAQDQRMDKEEDDILAFVEDTSSRDVIKQFASTANLTHVNIQNGGIAKACEYLSSHSSPNFLIIDISRSQDVLRDIRLLADVCDAQVQVVVIGDKDEVDLYRQLLGEGVRDYLIRPINVNHLRGAFDQGSSVSKGGVIVTYLSAHGGAGSTTLALASAGSIASQTHRYTCLVDGDLLYGPMALIADRKPGKSLIEALKHPERIDNMFLDRALEKLDDRLSLLCGKADVSDDLRSFSKASYAQLFRVLQERFRYLFIDGPRWLDAYRHAALEVSSHIVLIAHPTLIGLRNVIDMMSQLEQYDQSRVSIVLNGYSCHKKGEIPREKFAKTLGRDVNYLVRFDPYHVLAWINSGVLCPDKGMFYRDMNAMLHGLFPHIESPKGSMLSGWNFLPEALRLRSSS